MALALLLPALAAGLLSCGSSNQLTESKVKKQIAQLERGIDKDKVLKLMGRNPDDKTLIDGRETWRYKTYIHMDAKYKVIDIGFIDGKVEYYNTYDMDNTPARHPR